LPGRIGTERAYHPTMRQFLALSLLSIGCAAAPPPEPRVVERVVYVQAPCPAPVIVEHHGYRVEPKVAHHEHPTRWLPTRGMKRHSKHEKLVKRCDKKKTPEARERCRRDMARR